MSLRDLEEKGLLVLPADDDAFLLSCTDNKGDCYSSEITHINETVSRFFLSVFGIENYDKSMEEILKLDLTVKNPSVTLFKKYPILWRR